eukprot:5385437-Alexandrium_andersonii.AAC.1
MDPGAGVAADRSSRSHRWSARAALPAASPQPTARSGTSTRWCSGHRLRRRTCGGTHSVTAATS